MTAKKKPAGVAKKAAPKKPAPKKAKKPAAKKPAPKASAKKSSKAKKPAKGKKGKKQSSSYDMGIVIMDDPIEVDRERVNEERRAYLEEARSQEAGD